MTLFELLWLVMKLGNVILSNFKRNRDQTEAKKQAETKEETQTETQTEIQAWAKKTKFKQNKTFPNFIKLKLNNLPVSKTT